MRTAEQHAALAYIVAAIRPDWDRRGIEAQLARLDPAVSLAAVTHAAVTHAAIVAAATRPDRRTPAVIAMAGPLWAGCLDERPSTRLATWEPVHPSEPLPPAQVAHHAQLAREAREAARKEPS